MTEKQLKIKKKITNKIHVTERELLLDLTGMHTHTHNNHLSCPVVRLPLHVHACCKGLTSQLYREKSDILWKACSGVRYKIFDTFSVQEIIIVV